MKHWVSFSGGVGSAVSALVAHMNGYDFEMVMADTNIEDDDLWRFTKDVAKAVGKELVVLNTGKTPWDVFVEKRFIGNTRTAHCSTVLKTEPIMRFLDKYAHPDDPLVLGMNFGETDRLDRARARWSPRPVKSLLCDHRVTNRQCDFILSLFGIKKPKLYGMGFPHNNCGGFCVKAGLKQFATLLEKMPDRFEHHASEMQRVTDTIGPTARPFLRRTQDGVTQYMNLAQFKVAYENGDLKVSPYDFGGCGCFTDD